MHFGVVRFGLDLLGVIYVFKRKESGQSLLEYWVITT